MAVRVVGAVLAGGASRRMGEAKALAEVDGVPMAARVAAALGAGGAVRVVLVGGGDEVAGRLGLDLVADRWPGEGPLGGIATALLQAQIGELTAPGDPAPRIEPSTASDEVIVVVAPCDQPDLTGEIVARLVDALVGAPPSVLVAVPRSGDGRRQPLPAAWRVSAGTVLAELVEAGARRAGAALDQVGVVLVPASTGELEDLDTPEDLARRRALGPHV